MKLVRGALFVLLASLSGLGMAGSPGPSDSKYSSPKVSEIDRWIKDIRDRYEGKRFKVEGEEDEGEEYGVDYILGLRHRTFIRSYPYDSYDPQNYERAANHISAMPLSPRAYQRPGANAPSKWEFTGPKNLDVPYRTYYGVRPTSGRVNNIAIDPTNGQRIFLAAAGGGIWRTTDGGVNWVSVGDSFEMQNTQSVALDPRNPNTVYAGTGDFNGFEGYPFGLKRSKDGGETWETLGQGVFGNRVINSVLVDPSDSDTIFVAAANRSNDGFVWKTTNGGSTWTQAFSLNAGWYNLKLGAPDANGKRVIYAIGLGGTPRIQRSRDNGVTWEAAAAPFSSGGGSVDIAPSTITPGTVYVIAGATESIYKSTNFGDSWTNVTNNHPGGYNWSQSWYDWHITASAANGQDVLYTGLIDIVQSKDSGASWASVGRTYTGSAITHNDQHCATVDPSNPNRVIFGNDGGVYELIYNPGTGSSTINALSKTLGITQFYDADWHPTNPNIMLGGTQDNATPVSTGDLENWINRAGGDGFQVWISPTNPLIQYATIYSCTVIRTTNGWGSQQDISPNLSDPTPFVTPVEGDPNNQNVVYTGNAWLHRWNNGTWSTKLGGQMLGSSTNDHISAIKVAVGDSNRVYVATQSGRLWMTSDGGTTWRDIRNGLPNRSITNLDIHPSNKADLLVTFSGFGTGHVYRTTNVEATTIQWINVSGEGSTGLPDIPANAITRHWEDPASRWFVGTDLGVFATEDGGQTWSNFSTGLGFPNVVTTAVKAVPGTAYLNAATYGRGMWRIDVTIGAELSGITLNSSSVLGGTTVQGTLTMTEPPQADTVVTLTSDNENAVVPPSVTVPAGQGTVTFSVTTNPVATVTNTNITASLGVRTRTAPLTINPPRTKAVTLSPAVVYGGYPSTATVELDAPAPVNGTTVLLSSSQATIAQVPTSVVVPAGQTKASFEVTTKVLDSQTISQISASVLGVVKSANLTVRPIGVSNLVITPLEVFAGATAKATVVIQTKAPEPLQVTLGSSQPLYASVPTSITIPKGADRAVFNVTTKGTNINRTINIRGARSNISYSRQIIVKAPLLVSLTAPAGDKVAGTAFEVTVTLNGPAPAEGTVVALKSSNTSLLTVPASVVVPAQARTVTFKALAKGATTRTAVTATATLRGVSKNLVVYVLPPSIGSVTLTPSTVKGGVTSTATARLTGPAPAGGMLLNLSTSDNLVAYTGVSSIRVPAGQTSIQFFVYTRKVAKASSASVIVTQGTNSKSAVLTVNP